MNINILDNQLNKIAIVDEYTSLIWCKRYNDIGAIDLQIEATEKNLELFNLDYYITRDDDNSIYKITAIELDTQATHDNSLIIGAIDCKSILSQRIIWNQTVFSGTVENYIRKLLNDNIINPTIVSRKINNFILKNSHGYTETIIQQVSYDNLSEKIIELCKSYNYGFEISFENNNFYFDIYKGVDRSESQSERNRIIFSPEFDNLSSSKYKSDIENYKNVVLVGGEGEGTNRKLKAVGMTSGLSRKEMFVNASQTSTINGDETITDAEYYEQLNTIGENSLAENSVTKSFEGEIISDSYKYKTDYNLGDIVTLKNEYGITIDARITEIIETWNSEGYTLEPKFDYMEVETDETEIGILQTENLDAIQTEENEIVTLEESNVESVEGISTKKISELPVATELNNLCCFPVVNNSETKKVTFEELQEQIVDSTAMQTALNLKQNIIKQKNITLYHSSLTWQSGNNGSKYANVSYSTYGLQNKTILNIALVDWSGGTLNGFIQVYLGESRTYFVIQESSLNTFSNLYIMINYVQ